MTFSETHKTFETKKGRVTKYDSALNDQEFFGKKKKKGKTAENPNYIKIDHAIITTQEVSVKTLSEKIIVSIIKKNRKQNVFRYLFNGLPSRNRTYN